MSYSVVSLTFQADGDSKEEAAARVRKALKSNGLVTGVSNFIDYVPGKYLVHVDVRTDNSDSVAARDHLWEHFEKNGLKPHGATVKLLSDVLENVDTGDPKSLASNDSRVLAADVDESSLLD